MVIRLIVVALVVGACSQSPVGTHEALEIARAEQRWTDHRPASYTYEVRVSCFCPPQLGGWTEVSVVGDAVVSVKSLTPALGHLEPLQLSAWPTVPRLFEVVKAARRGGHIKDVTASYDSQFGYPTSINITCTPDLLDCGSHYEARNFKAVP